MIDLVAAFEGRPPGAVLIDEEIRRLADEAKLISDFAEDSLQPASYDLRLGSEYFLGGARQRLSYEQRSCALASGEFMLVTSREELTLPLDVVARAGLISHWAQKGLISLLSTQIDPGFVGIMIVPILNAGHAPVTLEYCEPIITVEFMRTTVPVKTGWVNLPGNMPQRRIPDSTELRMASPGLTPVTERLDELETSVRQMRAWHEGYFQGKGEKQGASGVKWAVISGVVAILALIVALVLALIDVI